jgi:hypothetical protein
MKRDNDGASENASRRLKRSAANQWQVILSSRERIAPPAIYVNHHAHHGALFSKKHGTSSLAPRA